MHLKVCFLKGFVFNFQNKLLRFVYVCVVAIEIL